MADSDNSLLIRIKGDSSGGKAAIDQTRAALASLRTTSTKEFGAMQSAATSSLGQITSSIAGVAGQVPILGGAINSLSSGLSTMAGESTAAAGSLAAIAGPAGIAVAVFVGLTAGAASLAEGLFHLAESAADFRGKMFDLSQQTGVAVETLSALEVVASTTGGSIESVSQSLVIFQGHLDAAQDSTSAMGIKFKELKISTDNTEDAFRDALKVLSEMPEGFHQTNEAAELFGKRGGKQVLALLKEMDGDLPGLMAKLKGLGLLISTEDAKAADEFNDQLQILTLQFRALLGKEVIPAALIALQSLSGLFQENARSINFLGQVLGSFSNTVLAGFLLKLQEVQLVLVSIEALAGALDRAMGHTSLPGLSAGAGATSPFAGLQSGAGAVEPAQRAARRAAGEDPATAAARLAALRLQGTLERLSEEDRLTKQSLDRRKADFELYATEIKFTEDSRHLIVMSGLIHEEEAVGKLRDGLQKEIALREIQNKKAEESNRHQAAADDLDDQRLKIQNEINETIDKLNASTKEYIFTVDKYQQAVDDLVESLDKQGVSLDPLIEKTLRFDAAMAGARDRTREAIAALEDLSNAPTPPTLAGADNDQIAQQAGAIANAVAGLPPVMIDTKNVFGELGKQISDVFGLGREGAEVFGGLMSTAFGTLAQAVGEAVHAFVLFGSAGIGIKKFTAVMIAEIAKMAAVQAVWELAQGLAMLALNFFWPDPKLALAATGHFHAAAVYGGLAAIATSVGRGVAGNSFAATGGGGTSGTGAGNPGRNPSDRPGTIEANRLPGAQSQPPTIVIHLSGEAAAAFDYKVVKAVIGNHRVNGEIRRMTETGES